MGMHNFFHSAVVPIVSTRTTRNLDIGSECFNAVNYNIYHLSLSSHPYTHLDQQVPLVMLSHHDQISRCEKNKRYQQVV
jgi:hypothetical protein